MKSRKTSVLRCNALLGAAFIAEIRKSLQEPICNKIEPKNNTDINNEFASVRRIMEDTVVNIQRRENRVCSEEPD